MSTGDLHNADQCLTEAAKQLSLAIGHLDKVSKESGQAADGDTKLRIELLKHETEDVRGRVRMLMDGVQSAAGS